MPMCLYPALLKPILSRHGVLKFSEESYASEKNIEESIEFCDISVQTIRRARARKLPRTAKRKLVPETHPHIHIVIDPP